MRRWGGAAGLYPGADSGVGRRSPDGAAGFSLDAAGPLCAPGGPGARLAVGNPHGGSRLKVVQGLEAEPFPIRLCPRLDPSWVPALGRRLHPTPGPSCYRQEKAEAQRGAVTRKVHTANACGDEGCVLRLALDDLSPCHIASLSHRCPLDAVKSGWRVSGTAAAEGVWSEGRGRRGWRFQWARLGFSPFLIAGVTWACSQSSR